MYGVRKLADGISTSSRRGRGTTRHSWGVSGEGYGTELGIVTARWIQMDPNGLGMSWECFGNVLDILHNVCSMWAAHKLTQTIQTGLEEAQGDLQPLLSWLHHQADLSWLGHLGHLGTLRLAKKCKETSACWHWPIQTTSNISTKIPPNMYQELAASVVIPSRK